MPTPSPIDVILPGGHTEFNDILLAIGDAKTLIKGVGIMLVGIIDDDSEVRVMNKAHEEGGCDTS